jgi:hypothetical protein
MQPDYALSEISRLISKKDEIRKAEYGRWSDKTILILILLFCPLEGWLEAYINSNIIEGERDSLKKDLNENGFLEVWLVDVTTVAKYSTTELFGIKPLSYWGYHPPPDHMNKPYG